MKYLLLSTYPISGSKNSGDDLIGKSLIKLLKNMKGKDIQVDIAHVTDQASIEELAPEYKAILAPAIRPTVNGESVVPKFRNKYLEFALQQNIPFYAIGAGWKQYPGTASQSMNLSLDASEIQYFKELFNKRQSKSFISTRDIFTENVLKENGIACYGTTGDLGLFDFNYLGMPAKLPKKIKTIAVSMPHNRYHFSKAYDIAVKLKKKYSCNVKIVFHGNTRKFAKLKKRWSGDSIEVVDLSGGAEKLEYYNDIDLHVGFRLHAHIWFLRTRKPSLLIAEDGRSSGHLATINGLGYSAAPKSAIILAELFPKKADEYRGYFSKVDPPDDVFKMLEDEIKTGYKTTKKSLQLVDKLWDEQMKPFLNLIPK